MPLDLGAVRAGIAANLATLPKLKRSSHAYVPDSIAVPCAIVDSPETHTFDTSFGRGTDEATIPVLLLVGRVSVEGAQEQLDAWASGAGEETVKAAIERDRQSEEGALGGACDDCRVTAARGYGRYTFAGNEYLGVEFLVQVVG